MSRRRPIMLKDIEATRREINTMILIRTLAFCLAASVLTTVQAAADEAANAALRAKAHATCRKPEYRQDTKVVINYAKGWFRCDPPKNYKTNGKRK